MEKMRMKSLDMVEQNVNKIGAIFPNCITEIMNENSEIKKGINFELLRQMLSNDIAESNEAYEFTWVGKKAAIVEANKPIKKTLRPCPEESVDWDSTENLYIEGDNLEVLKLLQESYLNKVKMIYIDPPYNTGNDFIYNDDFKMTGEEYADEIGEIDENGNRMFKNTDSNGRFHSDWCSMMYSRLMLARNLISDDGAIFISIGDEELFNLKKIADEIFGEKNFIANLIWQSTPGSNTGEAVKTVTENILLFAKNKSCCNFLNQVISNGDKYANVDEYFEKRGGYVLNKLDRRMTGNHYSEALNYQIEMPDGTLLYPGSSTEKQEHWNWRWSSSKVKWGIKNGFIVRKQTNGRWGVYFKQYEKVNNEDKLITRTLSYQNLLNVEGANSARGTREVMETFNGKFFDYPKPLSLIKYIEGMILDKNDIILDFFSGSATIANAIMELNAKDFGERKFILIQLPEKTNKDSEAYKAGYSNICEIGKERIRRAAKKIAEEHPDAKFDGGFRVLKLDDTNMNEVYYSPADYSQGFLNQLESNIKSDRTELDLLFGCLLEWGLPLSLPYSSEQIEGYTVHNYNDGDLIACFDENIPDSVIKKIAEKRPLRAVFRDSSFADSPSKINVDEIFKLIAPDTRVKVI